MMILILILLEDLHDHNLKKMKRVAQRKRRSGKPPLNFVLSTFPVELRRKRILRIVCTNDTEPHTKFRNRADIWYTNYVGVHPLHPTNEIHGWGVETQAFWDDGEPKSKCLLSETECWRFVPLFGKAFYR